MPKFQSSPPRIETERLLLTGHTVEDFTPLAALWADPEVTRQIGLPPSDAQTSWMRLLRYRGLWPLLGYGYWAVREKGSGAEIEPQDRFHLDHHPSPFYASSAQHMTGMNRSSRRTTLMARAVKYGSGC